VTQLVPKGVAFSVVRVSVIPCAVGIQVVASRRAERTPGAHWISASAEVILWGLWKMGSEVRLRTLESDYAAIVELIVEFINEMRR